VRLIGSVVAGLVALTVVVAAAAWPPRFPEPDPRPNIVVIVTDDQPYDSLSHDPPIMPYLQGQIEDPNGHWISFSNAFVETPLCCPSRSTVLTGRTSSHTGVGSNEDGHLFDDSSTLATWLDDAGYHTGLVGKYLNGYPFGRKPFVPPGWDAWAGKQQGSSESLYHDFTVIRSGMPMSYAGRAYSTDVFTEIALEFLRTAPIEDPFFLYFAPTAPHPPWIPPERHEGAYADLPIVESPAVTEDVSDKPAWVRSLLPLADEERARLIEARRNAYEALLGVDGSVRSILDMLRARGTLEHTVVIYFTDNGYSFGEHRWVKKSCPYEACIRTPFAVRMPDATARVEPGVLSLLGIAPTVAELAGVEPSAPVDGQSFAPVLRSEPGAALPETAFVEFEGDETIPPWWELRTSDHAYVEYATGERELYDLRLDPFELTNVASDPAYADVVARLASSLLPLRSG
jgi:arylsulfatase A-like enzyme